MEGSTFWRGQNFCGTQARIGVLRQAYERPSTDHEIERVFMAAVEDLRKAGATIVDPASVALDTARRQQGAGSCGGFN